MKESFTMKNTELTKSKILNATELIEYATNSVVIKSIIQKITGNVKAISFDSGELLKAKISPFDTFLQIIEGNAEIVINDKSNLLMTGQCIIIPAHSRNTIKAHQRCKVISTVIKSGYEEVN